MIDKQQIINNLINDFQFKTRGNHLREGVCPQCGKKSMFIKTDDPMNIKCGRENKCAYSVSTKKLYPQCFKPIEETHPPTPRNPHNTANAYIKIERGLELDRVWEQSTRYEYKATSEPKGTTTVKFTLPNGTTWERYLKPIQMSDGPKKSHFTGEYKGHWWKHPNKPIEANESIYLVEAIIDALSLIAVDLNAVSLMSCHNFPTESIQPYLGLGIQWKIALDNDHAGIKNSRIFLKKLQELGEKAQIISVDSHDKQDWNDIYKATKDKPEKLKDILKKAKLNGAIIAATAADQKAFAIVDQSKALGFLKRKFAMDFNDKWYWCSYKESEESGESIELTKICNCNPQFQYFQKDISTGESAYFYTVTRAGSNRTYKEALSSSAHTSAAEFKKALANVGAGLLFTGNTQQLDNYAQNNWFNNPNPNEIQTINFIGYSKEFKAWIFKDSAIINGKLCTPNEYDFFKLPNGEGVKTTYKAEPLQLSNNHKPSLWADDFKAAYGVKGVVTMAYWLGSYFAEQIRHDLEKFPFLELSGDAGTGKTGILEFLWKLTGRNSYEGVELSKASHAGRWRTLEQSANLPIVLMEGDRAEGNQKKTFDLNEAKGLFNGRGMRITGVKNGGSETREPPFRGALVIAQNEGIDSEPAVMERIVKIHWDKSHFSNNGYHASNRLKLLDINEINGFMVKACTQEQQIMPTLIEAFKRNYQELDNDNELINIRVKETHAQLLALVEVLANFELCPLTTGEQNTVKEHIKVMAKDRQNLLLTDPPELQEFWEAFDYLNSLGDTKPRVNHSKDNNLIAINLNQFESMANDHRISTPAKSHLKKLIHTTRRYKYIDYKTVSSSITGKSIRCYVFKAAA